MLPADPHHSDSLHLSMATTHPQALKNSIALLWLLIWLTGAALSGMGLLAAALVRRPGLATPLAFALYILAWVFQLVISLGFPYAPGVHWGDSWAMAWAVLHAAAAHVCSAACCRCTQL
jgi:hypothetical protein